MSYDTTEEDDNFELVDYTAASPWEKFVASVENQLCKLKVNDGKRGDFAIDELRSKCSSLVIKHRQYRSAVLGQVSTLCTKVAPLSYRGSSYALTLSVHPLLAAATAAGRGGSIDKLAMFDSYFPSVYVPELEIDNSQAELEAAWHPLHRWTGSSVLIYLRYLGDDNDWTDSAGDEAEGGVDLGGNYSISLETAKLLMSSMNIAAQNVQCQLPIFVPIGDAWRCLFTGRLLVPAEQIGDNGDGCIVALVKKIESVCLPHAPTSYLQLNGLIELYANSFRLLAHASLPDDSHGGTSGSRSTANIGHEWDFVSSAVSLVALHTYRIKNTYSRDWNTCSSDFIFRAGDLNVGPANDPLRLLTLSALFQHAPCGTYVDPQALGRDRLYIKTATAWLLSASMFPADRERTMLTEALEDAFAAWAQLANEANRHRHLSLSEQMEAHAEVTSDMLIDLFGPSATQHITPPGLGMGASDFEAATRLQARLEQTFAEVYAIDEGVARPPSIAQLIARMTLGSAVPHNSLLWRLSEIILVTTAKRSADFWRAPSSMTFLRLLWAMALKEIRWRWENERFIPRIPTSAELCATREGLRSGTETPKSSAAASQSASDILGTASARFNVHLQYALVYQKLEMLNCCLERKQTRGDRAASSAHTGTNAALVVPTLPVANGRGSSEGLERTASPDSEGLAQRIRTHVKDQIRKRIGETGADISQRAWAQGSRIRRPIGRLLNSMRPLEVLTSSSGSAGSHSPAQSIVADLEEFEEIKADESYASDSDGFVSAEDMNGESEEGQSSSASVLPLSSGSVPAASSPMAVRFPANAVRRRPDTEEPPGSLPLSGCSIGETNYVDVAISSSMDSTSGFYHVSDVYEREHPPTPMSDGFMTGPLPKTGQKASANGDGVAACTQAGDDERLGGLYPSDTLRLLESDEALWIPKIQMPPVMTEDMLREREAILMGFGTSSEGAQQRAQLQCADLISDMESFKAANPGCILADFVRWHSPRDWIVPEGKSEREGCLSVRMAGGGEGNLWQQLWTAARRVPADKQKLLFDFEMEAEKALHYLEGIPVFSLFATLLPIVFAIAYERLYKQPVVHRMPLLRERLSALGQKLAQQVDWTAVDPENAMFSSLMDDLEDLEVQTSRCVSLLHKFPEQYALVQTLVSCGQAIVDDRKVQKVVLKALARYNISGMAPTRREYVLSSDLLGLKPTTKADSAAQQQRMYVAIDDDRSIRVVYGRVKVQGTISERTEHTTPSM
ncbi:hypothetical protein GGI20_005502 [Coemansia sp. BCRC 34301]|nr:hypothetical protein GGI20_005502 [Coemansia sp. BCRC 34301]